MRLMLSLPFLVLAVCCCSCGEPSEPESSAGIEASGRSAVWSGAFVSPVLQHPIIEMDQKYFRPGSDDEAEWIAIVPEPLVDRVRLDAPVRVRGRLEDVELGGPAGSKASYRGKKLLVTEILDGDASPAPGSGADFSG